MSVLSLANIVFVGITWKRFLTLKTWQKIGTGLGIFLVSHHLGTYQVKRESEKMNDVFINKYKYVLDGMSFADKSNIS